MILLETETLEKHINQNGVRPGATKLLQFRWALRLRGTPKIYTQDGLGDKAKVFVKIFDPAGSWTWFITEWNETTNEAFGLVHGFEDELGYMNLEEMASVRGNLGIGLEIDVHFLPTTLGEVKKSLA